MKFKVLLLTVLFTASGCLLPKAPNWTTVKSTQTTVSGIQVHQMAHAYKKKRRGGAVRPRSDRVERHANAIYVAVDQYVQELFGEDLGKLYKQDPPPRLEDISWWQYSKKMKFVYNKVIRIPHHLFNMKTLEEAIALAEAEDLPYDVYIMTHGLPNNLIASEGEGLISYEEIGSLKGKLTKLRLLFMQACFGSSLAQDWLAAGANTVISYPEWNRNFFYPEFFLEQMLSAKREGIQFTDRQIYAYDKTNEKIVDKMGKSKLYKTIIKGMGKTFDEYVAEAPNPEIYY